MSGPTMLVFGDLCMIWGLWTRRAVEFVRLTGHPRRSMVDSSAGNGVNCDSSAQEISEGNNISNLDAKSILVIFQQRTWLVSALF